jgi:hypothetical protein
VAESTLFPQALNRLGKLAVVLHLAGDHTARLQPDLAEVLDDRQARFFDGQLYGSDGACADVQTDAPVCHPALPALSGSLGVA